MKKNYYKYKNLIMKGFSLEDISFEFDVPVEELQKIKEQVELEEQTRLKMAEVRKQVESEIKRKEELEKIERENAINLANQQIEEIEKNDDLSNASKKEAIARNRVILQQIEEKEKKEKSIKSAREKAEMERQAAQKLRERIERKRKEKRNTNTGVKYKKQSKMEIIRDNYNRLFYKGSDLNNTLEKNNVTENIKDEDFSKDIKSIEKMIGTLDYKGVKALQELKNIFDQVENIEKKSLSEEQATYLYKVLSNDVFLLPKVSKEVMKSKKISLKTIDAMKQKALKLKKLSGEKIIKIVEIKAEESDDIDELKRLKKMISSDITRDSYMLASTVDSKLQRKIMKLTADKRKSAAISPEIKKVIIGITNNTIDENEANKIIKEEINKNNTNSNKFALTEDEKKEMLLKSIMDEIQINAKEYEIEDSQSAIENLQKICGADYSKAFETVVMNHVNREEFDEAKSLCKKIEEQEEDTEVSNETLKRLKNTVRNNELGKIILKGIKRESNENDDEFIKLIDDGLALGNINLSAINLGKSKDGKRTITLRDVWPTDKRKDRYTMDK